MHIRFVFYVLIAAALIYTGTRYGWREIISFVFLFLALMIAGELGAYLKWRKHRNDK